MKKSILGLIILIGFVFFVTSGLFEPLTKFFVWLVTLNMTQSPISITGEIFVKISTFVISYTAVGAIFNAIGWHDSKIMRIAYFIISTLVSFALCWLVMIFETHLLLISIIVGALFVIAIAYSVITSTKERKKE